jgi:RND family efflux transporter MFP subunit
MIETEDKATSQPRTVSPQQVQPRRKHGWLALIIILVIVAAIVIGGIVPRLKARAALKVETYDLALSNVNVIHPTQGAPQSELVLPGNMQAFMDAPIYARTNGYLKKWYVDIGARVKANQLLAEIETPEVDQQLEQARADLTTAQANLSLSEITAKRYEDLKNTDSVSKQDVDNAHGDYEAKKATVASAQYNVKRLQELQSFQRIYAPFDGVITARNTDIGDLINSGSSTAPKTDLFYIAQPRKLRVYVNVPEEYSRGITVGMTADLSLAEFPDRRFQGKVVRTADAINVTTRTLLVEIDVDNPTGTLLTGSYAEVHLAVPTQASTCVIPVNTLLFRTEGLRVGIVKNGKVVLTAVTPGHDFGDQIEIVSGLKSDDQVIVNPPDSLVSGQEVQIVQATLPGDIR